MNAKQTNELTALLANIAGTLQALSTRVDALETSPRKAAVKEASKTSSRKASTPKTNAKREAYLAKREARNAEWAKFEGRPEEAIEFAASRIVANRKSGTINANIDAADIRHHLTTDEHQALRRATWKDATAKEAGLTFTAVCEALSARVAALSAKRSARKVR